ncbi:hypothetical protein ACEV9R_17585 [Vibrio parahaemolyticus]
MFKDMEKASWMEELPDSTHTNEEQPIRRDFKQIPLLDKRFLPVDKVYEVFITEYLYKCISEMIEGNKYIRSRFDHGKGVRRAYAGEFCLQVTDWVKMSPFEHRNHPKPQDLKTFKIKRDNHYKAKWTPPSEIQRLEQELAINISDFGTEYWRKPLIELKARIGSAKRNNEIFIELPSFEGMCRIIAYKYPKEVLKVKLDNSEPIDDETML